MHPLLANVRVCIVQRLAWRRRRLLVVRCPASVLCMRPVLPTVHYRPPQVRPAAVLPRPARRPSSEPPGCMLHRTTVREAIAAVLKQEGLLGCAQRLYYGDPELDPWTYTARMWRGA
jgi:hypothetical protein